METLTDGLGRPLRICSFWSCGETFPAAANRKFCSRGCKQADSKRKSRKADTTREKRRAAGREAGFEDGHLYVIQPGDMPYVKVGYSKNWEERMRIMQTSNYAVLEAISLLPVKRYFKNDPPDKEVHLLLSEEDYVRGEWWRLTDTTVKVLREFGFPMEGIATRPPLRRER